MMSTGIYAPSTFPEVQPKPRTGWLCCKFPVVSTTRSGAYANKIELLAALQSDNDG